MSSHLYRGTVWHVRRSPVEHAFSYPLYLLGVSLTAGAEWRDFPGVLQRRGLAIWKIEDRDYFAGSRSLHEEVSGWLARAGLPPGSEVLLITMPRYFGYVFNPVSFFLARDSAGRLCRVLAQVRNTFGEMFLYDEPLVPDADGSGTVRAGFDKEFYVSPFFDVSGRYEIVVPRCEGHVLDLQVRLFKGEAEVFASGIKAHGEPLTRGALIRAGCALPLTGALTMIRIQLHAIRLFFQRRLPFQPRGATPRVPPTRVAPGLWDRFRLLVVRAGLRVRG